MDQEPLACRLAGRLRFPVVTAATVCTMLVAADLATHSIPHDVIACAAVAAGAAAAGIFLCAVFDRRFHNALSALNLERRQQTRSMGLGARLFGLGLPAGDRILFLLNAVLLAEFFAAAMLEADLSTVALAFTAFLLVSLTRIALMTRAYPTGEFRGLFT